MVEITSMGEREKRYIRTFSNTRKTEMYFLRQHFNNQVRIAYGNNNEDEGGWR